MNNAAESFPSMYMIQKKKYVKVTYNCFVTEGQMFLFLF